MELPIYYAWAITVVLFALILMIGRFIFDYLKNNRSRFLNLSEYFPEEELNTLRQVYYLIMMLLFFIFILYCVIFSRTNSTSIALLEIIVLTYVALTLDLSTWKKNYYSF